MEMALRRVVADEISEHRRQARANGGPWLGPLDERQMARAILHREMDLRAREALRLGEQPLADTERADLVDAVMGQVFSALPGLEQHLGREDAVDIHVQGARDLIVELMDGTVEHHPSPFASDDEMVDVLAGVARRWGVVENEFNYSHPILRLPLPDGSRLTANAWIGTEPYLTVRRHPLVDRDLDDLCALGMFDPEVRSLLGAAVRARWNVLFAGAQGDGKTTLMRAAVHDADRDERKVVIESIPELHLDRLPHRHSQVVSLWERSPNMEGDGAVTVADLTWHAKHLSPKRLLVGEVLSDEVVPMLEAMSQGVGGGMCTMHARSSAGVFPRLPVYARAGGRDWRTTDVWELAAEAVDLVVFVARDVHGKRTVAEVRHVERFDHDSGRIVSDTWFGRDRRTGRATPAAVPPVDLLDELVAHGYTPNRIHRVEEAVR